MTTDVNDAKYEFARAVLEDMKTSSGLVIAEEDVQSFLDLIVELLPILADLIGRNCDPDNQVERIQRRASRNAIYDQLRLNRGVRWQLGNDGYDEVGGKSFVKSIFSVTAREATKPMLEAILTDKPPVWGAFDGTAA